MAATGREPVGSMGCDTPLAVLSGQPQLLYSYFQQMFAQVTNPPIDSIREELVMSLMTFIGNPGNILADDPRNCRLIKLLHPVLSNEDLDLIRRLKLKDFRTVTIPMGFPAGGGGPELEAALTQMCTRTRDALSANVRNLIILSDRDLPDGTAPIPALLAVAAINRFLVRHGNRTEFGRDRGNRRGARGPSHCGAAGLRGHGGEPVPGVRERGGPGGAQDRLPGGERRPGRWRTTSRPSPRGC